MSASHGHPSAHAFRSAAVRVLVACALVCAMVAVILRVAFLGGVAFGILMSALIIRPPSQRDPDADTSALDAVAAEPAKPAVSDASVHPGVSPEPLVPPVSDVEPSAVLASIAREIQNDGWMLSIHLWLEDPSSATLRLVASTGMLPVSQQPIPLSDELVSSAMASGQVTTGPVARMTVGAAEHLVTRTLVPLSTPVARGALMLDVASASTGDLRAITERVLDTEQLAAALCIHVAHTESEHALSLLDAAREMSRLIDPDALLEYVLDTAMVISGALRGSIMLVDEGDGALRIVRSRGIPEDIVRSTSVAPGEGIAGWVYSTGQPLLVEDVPARRRGARASEVRSALCVPIADDEGVLGVLNMGSKDFPARFTDTHLKTLQTLGRHTAVSLRNAWAIGTSRTMYFDALVALVTALETKDPYARGGAKRGLACATALGETLRLSEPELRALRIAAVLHDIGMTAAADGLESLSRPLTTVERGLVTLHPSIAAEILAESPAMREVVPIVYHHHEWYDGHGYVDGLAGESIPFGARILAVADAFVALTSDRPYRRALSVDAAVAHIREKAGSQFDPAVVEALLEIQRTDRARLLDQSASG